ncbi:hypothetical protein BDN72DRAFT_842494 [Pluteus cervinus]|uniref:Uncharacterized protein n=1 Tax=Pluteus cervinus TaxID=181527 RepID=A0ACD3AQF4_9AGAR|nr:hypothetical protein BDN72DRAFT_842494 [Pluteus cervinus]
MTTTIAEAFDAPMLDYATDIDVSMHHSASDNWLHQEAHMEDDGHIFRSHHSADPHNSAVLVEVDMEPYDESHSTEYEMTDSASIFVGQEIQDVELYDVSSANSPFHHAAVVSEPPNPPHSPFQQPTLATPAELTPSSDRTHQDAQDIDNLHPATSEIPPSPLPPQDHSGSFPGGLPASIQTSAAEPQSPSVITTTLHPEPQAVLVHPSAEAPAELDQGPLLQQQVQEAPEEQDDDHVSSEDPPLSSADPHEISDGVYIDPPPAVSLQIIAGEEQTTSDFLLFNNSTIKPYEDSQPNTKNELGVLLSEYPTLYYEPLASLSEALRRELDATLLPDLADGEVIFDAYDLLLQISEDNVYAREVTLHDLNILHDGSGLSGPLRLRLRVVAPRFITRYRLLQSQVSDLHLDSKEDISHGSSGAHLEGPSPSVPIRSDRDSPAHQLPPTSQDHLSDHIAGVEEGVIQPYASTKSEELPGAALKDAPKTEDGENTPSLPPSTEDETFEQDNDNPDEDQDAEGDNDEGDYDEEPEEQSTSWEDSHEDEHTVVQEILERPSIEREATPNATFTSDDHAQFFDEQIYTEEYSAARASSPENQYEEPGDPEPQEVSEAPGTVPFDDNAIASSPQHPVPVPSAEQENAEASSSEEINDHNYILDADDPAVYDYEEFEDAPDSVEPFYESPARSNESSEHGEYEAKHIAQSSMRASSKRGYDDVESEADAVEALLQDSPGSKRVRIS